MPHLERQHGDRGAREGGEVGCARDAKRKRGRPRKGEERPREKRRLERQADMSLAEMLADLPVGKALPCLSPGGETDRRAADAPRHLGFDTIR